LTPISYRTVFELGLRSFPWARVLHPVLFIVIELLLFRFGKRRQIYQAVGLIVASLASMFFLISLVVFIPEFLKLRSAYVSNRSSVIEGVVEDFRPAPALGPARESFSIRGVVFSYNAFDDTPCFHNAPIHSGPIRGGLDLRIHYKVWMHSARRCSAIT
jgi:hypothetical protein